MSNRFCNSIFQYQRLLTREVNVGTVGIGGTNPIRVQSMTTTDTMNTEATVAQSIRMIEAGCELVRITAPSINEAKNLENIRKKIREAGFETPLVADIHFTPNAAEAAARIVEKVRVNPGNYADKKKFEQIDYTESAYQFELERIRERFSPLVKICKEYGTAMRIGTNHGSLSDRILSRYGDTPLGMVESAYEFIKICEENNYYNLIISMKASNAQVMVQAYRMLAARMTENKNIYPLHLGVTEAGDGEDGRIKSAVGIGTLLEDGLGDTIRVSLTEDPEFEIPVAKRLAERYSNRPTEKQLADNDLAKLYKPFEYEKRNSIDVLNFGYNNVPRVILDLSNKSQINPATFFAAGYQYSVPNDKWNIQDMAVDFIYIGNQNIDFEIPGTLGIIQNYKTWSNEKKTRHYPNFPSISEFIAAVTHPLLNFIHVDSENIDWNALKSISHLNNTVLILNTKHSHGMASQRAFFLQLAEEKIRLPVVINRNYESCSQEEFQLHASTDFGALFLDGFGDGIWLNHKNEVSIQNLVSTAFGILQATRTRISKTEYISCPSCGRTLFDLQETTAKIRSRTDHLKGIKIGIMGCIVNGPGEMADADYGYVGTGPGKISLYKGKTVVKKNIESELAVDELIELIRLHGDWVDKTSVVL